MHYIYKFTNTKNGMVYVGETSNIDARIKSHIKQMNSPRYTGKHSLLVIEAFTIFSPDDFKFEILLVFNCKNRSHALSVEREFIVRENSLYPSGYNCRSYVDGTWVWSETYRRDYMKSIEGDKNPNYGNRWDADQINAASARQRENHKNGNNYDDEWRDKIGSSSRNLWASYSAEKIDEIMTKQSLASSKYDYIQKTKSGDVVKTWNSVREILKHNPTFRRQGIYSVVNGHKKSHRGYVWEKVLKNA